MILAPIRPENAVPDVWTAKPRQEAFQLVSRYKPAGDQPVAIDQLCAGVARGERDQVLLGATGTGKTFTMANVIARMNRPALILSHNKTLAAQLYGEFKEFFPHNAVRYFVSYYDYYQPEAYIPQRDIYIEKETAINDELDRLRLATTSALLSRTDVVIVASVSCIYGLGSPSDYKGMTIPLMRGATIDRDELLRRLVQILYTRNDFDFQRGRFRVRGDVVELWPSYEEVAYRIELFGDEIERLAMVNPVSGETIMEYDDYAIFPAKHFVLPQDRVKIAAEAIRAELAEQLEKFRVQGKLLEAQRLAARTKFDIEMLTEVGTCPGVENYSRHLTGRAPGERPACLLDFFPPEYLLFIDESHVTLPQIQAMYAGDRSRKTTLAEHGFRLPSALDNRPLKFEEWQQLIPQTVYVSATPGPYELAKTAGEVVEQVIRPTGLLDPVVEVIPARGQVQHLEEQIRRTSAAGNRTLVTTLTKRLAEDLAHYLTQKKIRCKWLHSELDAFERIEILQELRQGKFEVVVGINLLREGLDLPEVALVGILDADKEGFLRSATSFIQTIGRAARNVDSRVILYADDITPSMRKAIDETSRRRAKQEAYNLEHGITPESVRSAITSGIGEEREARKLAAAAVGVDEVQYTLDEMIEEVKKKMFEAAANQEFEAAVAFRDQLKSLEAKKAGTVEPATPQAKGRKRKRR